MNGCSRLRTKNRHLMTHITTHTSPRPRVGAKPPPVGADGGWSCEVHDLKSEQLKGRSL
jgi:hypothetical protein